MKTAIIGIGWVGQFMQKLFPSSVVYSRSSGNKREVNECDAAFVCVPTPSWEALLGQSISNTRPGNNDGEGRLDTSIVEEVVSWCECPLIVIRSTVNPGTCDYLAKKYRKNIVHQPEFLGETPNHPMLDPKTRQFLVIGGSPKDRRKLIELYQTVYNANISIRQVTNYEAEVIKLTENRAIAFKVAQCQELYDVCEKAGIDYYIIRDTVYGDDPRFDLWWTFVYPEKRGFNSKCIPKDVYAWCAWSESLGYSPKITRALLNKNKEWI